LHFFCQAEDGIRDATVTGVQTCALPICQLASAAPLEELVEGELQEGQGSHLSLHLEEQVAHQVALEGHLHVRQRCRLLNRRTQRSEERRVGKECRSPRSQEARKRNRYEK